MTLEFRKRGAADGDAAAADSDTLPAGATLYAPDVLSGFFNQENVAGFVQW